MNRIIEELANYLEELVAADQFSGTVLVAKDDTTLFQHAYGMAEKNFKVPAQLNTKYNLGSLNKMFTAVAIVQLAEQGKISLHEPISRYLPDYPRQRAERNALLDIVAGSQGLVPTSSLPPSPAKLWSRSRTMILPSLLR